MLHQMLVLTVKCHIDRKLYFAISFLKSRVAFISIKINRQNLLKTVQKETQSLNKWINSA